jgi:Methyltransferase domain
VGPALQSNSTSRADFGHILNELKLVGVGVEVGVFRGEFTEMLLRNWMGSLLILVDPWRHLPNYFDSWNLTNSEMEENYRFTIARLSPYLDRIHILRKMSQEAVLDVADGSCDFIYIDANHSYEAVSADLRAWYPKLRSGGMMAGHDYFDALADADLEPIMTSNARIPKGALRSYGVKTAEFLNVSHPKLQRHHCYIRGACEMHNQTHQTDR